MNKNTNGTFDNLRKLQEIVEKINFPSEQYLKQLSLIHNINYPLIRAALEANNSAIDLANSMKQASSLTTINTDFSALYSAMTNIAASPIYSGAPKDAIKLSETISRLLSGIDINLPTSIEDYSDLNATLTVRKKETVPLFELSWKNIIKFLGWLIPILIAYQIAAGDDVQHEEQMNLLKETNQLLIEQNQLQAEQIDLMGVEIKNQEIVNEALMELLEQMNAALQGEKNNSEIKPE